MAEGQVCQNADLASGVDALHIGGGIRLGVALGLGLPQGVGKEGAGTDHAGQDIIGSTVQNAVHLVDTVGGHTLGQGVQDGDAAAHAGLKQVVDVFLLRQCQQLTAMLRHQLLVGGDDVLARHQRPLRVFVGRLHAADGLHHHADVVVLFDLLEIVGHQLAVRAVLEVPDQNGLDLQGFPQLVFDLLGVFRHDLGNAGADSTQAHDRNLYHPLSPFPLSPPEFRTSPHRPARTHQRSTAPGIPPSRWSRRKW